MITMHKELTIKQMEMFRIIIKYIEDNGISPTVRELREIIGHKSTSTTHALIKGLEKKGFISKIKGSPRSIKIIFFD